MFCGDSSFESPNSTTRPNNIRIIYDRIFSGWEWHTCLDSQVGVSTPLFDYSILHETWPEAIDIIPRYNQRVFQHRGKDFKS
jgi:hypothetical protein